jgi:acetyl esterase/lipase
MLIHVGGDEVRCSTTAGSLRSVPEAAGVDVTLSIYEGMWHVFHHGGGHRNSRGSGNWQSNEIGCLHSCPIQASSLPPWGQLGRDAGNE